MKTIIHKIYAVILIGIILCYCSATIYGQKPQKKISELERVLQEMALIYNLDTFYTAVEIGDIDVVQLFIDSKEDFEIDGVSKKEMIEEAIFKAVDKGQVSITKLLLDSFLPNIILEVELDKSLIKRAISLGNISLLKLLLDKNIGINYIKTGSLNVVADANVSVIILLERKGLIAEVNSQELEIARNEKQTIEAMRLFHSVQATYQAGVGNGNFGSAEEIFMNDLIDPVLANAAGVGPMEVNGLKCVGNGSPKNGYKFLIFKKDADQANLADFVVIAIPIIAQGNDRTGNHSFYVDATGVIRMSNANETPSENSRPIVNE